MDSPEAKAALAPATVAMKAIPPISISADGKAGGIVDFEGYLERLRPELQRMGEEFPQMRELLEGTLRTMRLPMARPMIELRACQPWQTWVEAWGDQELAVGADKLIEEDFGPPGGQQARMQFTLRNHGLVEQPANHVKLSMVAEASGEGLKSVSMQLAQELALEMGVEAAELDLDDLDDLRMVTTTETVTDPHTLRPFWAVYERTVSLSVGSVVRKQVERRRYWFDWSDK